MNFSEIFKKVAPLYPKSMSLQGAINSSEDFELPELDVITDTIECNYNDEDSWEILMNWVLSVGIWKLAEEAFKRNKKHIDLQDVSLESVEKDFFRHLQHESYGDMISIYERHIEPGLEKYWGKNAIIPDPKASDYHWVVTDSTGKKVAHVDKSGKIIENLPPPEGV